MLFLIMKFNEKEIETEKIDFSKYNNFDELEEKLNWKYENEFLSNIPIKTTVSVLKKAESENVDFFDLNNNEVGLKDKVPEFLQDEKITSARIGTLTHFILQKLDFTKIKTKEDVKDFIQELVSKNFMKLEESKRVSVEKIYNFINSEFANKIKNSKSVYKEKPFCLSFPTSRIFKDNESDNKILVQGIIDLYFENENGNLSLIDYKTDYVENDESELIQKYRVQLELYKEALEKGTGKKVEEVYIYSLYLNKEIPLSI